LLPRRIRRSDITWRATIITALLPKGPGIRESRQENSSKEDPQCNLDNKEDGRNQRQDSLSLKNALEVSVKQCRGRHGISFEDL
jgi:hypothetical protein